MPASGPTKEKQLNVMNFGLGDFNPRRRPSLRCSTQTQEAGMRYRESLRGFIPRQRHILRSFTPTPKAVNGTFMNENCVYIDDLMKVYEVM